MDYKYGVPSLVLQEFQKLNLKRKEKFACKMWDLENIYYGEKNTRVSVEITKDAKHGTATCVTIKTEQVTQRRLYPEIDIITPVATVIAEKNKSTIIPSPTANKLDVPVGENTSYQEYVTVPGQGTIVYYFPVASSRNEFHDKLVYAFLELSYEPVSSDESSPSPSSDDSVPPSPTQPIDN